ncbi:hypothetical protein BaRGS_00018250 [Batillaria attramentaria]|uniref:Uncharacterized protein n=1 Tax=Batillaria attramentaria TaxID=370345 RepID=A0ABD0KU93_9CAEN
MMKDIRDVYLCQLVVLAIGVVGNVLSGVVWVTQIHYVGGAMFLLALSVSHSLTIIFRGIYSVQMLLDPTSCRAVSFSSSVTRLSAFHRT